MLQKSILRGETFGWKRGYGFVFFKFGLMEEFLKMFKIADAKYQISKQNIVQFIFPDATDRCFQCAVSVEICFRFVIFGPGKFRKSP